jgi:hypothetical protein
MREEEEDDKKENKAYRLLLGEPEGKQVYNIKLDFRAGGCTDECAVAY